jgi:hypothetical protein
VLFDGGTPLFVAKFLSPESEATAFGSGLSPQDRSSSQFLVGATKKILQLPMVVVLLALSTA